MTESGLQQAVITMIAACYPLAYIDVNPMSEMPIKGTDAYRFKVIADLKRRGWRKGRPDIIVSNPTSDGLDMVAIELKTPKENPFRAFRGGDGMWIDMSKNASAVAHVKTQIEHACHLNSIGYKFAGFAYSVDGAMAAMRGDMSKFGTYEITTPFRKGRNLFAYYQIQS